MNDFAPGRERLLDDVDINGRVLYRRGVKAFRDYSPVYLLAAQRPLPDGPLGPQPRALLPRPALLPQRQGGRRRHLRQPGHRERRPRANGAAGHPRRLRGRDSPRWPRRCRRPAWTRSRNPSAPTWASASCGASCARSSRSKARFKVIMNELPIQQYYVLPYDRWEGYEAERQRVLRALQDVPNVVFLTTDVHATLVNDARFQTLEPGGPRNSGITDVTVGSAATANLGLEIDTRPAAGQRHAGRYRLLRGPAARRRGHALLDRRPVQLRRGGGDLRPPDDHAEGDRSGSARSAATTGVPPLPRARQAGSRRPLLPTYSRRRRPGGVVAYPAAGGITHRVAPARPAGHEVDSSAASRRAAVAGAQVLAGVGSDLVEHVGR